MNCPNKNLEEYKSLEKELGEIRALSAFHLNKGKIPTIDEAKKLLDSKLLKILHHAQTPLDMKDALSGPLGEGLSKQGIDEANRLAQTPEIKKLKTIYTSDSPRAVQTAEIYKQYNKNLQIIPLSGLRTWNRGEFIGGKEKEFPTEHYINNPDEVVPGGESYNQFLSKFLPAIQDLRNIPEDFGVLVHGDGIKTLKALEGNYGTFSPTEYLKGPTIDASEKHIQEIRQFNTQPTLFQEPLHWYNAAERIYKGFKDTLKPFTIGQKFAGFTTRTGKDAFKVYQQMKVWADKIPDFKSVEILYDKGTGLINLYKNEGPGEEWAQLNNADSSVVNTGLKVVAAMQQPKIEQIYNKFYKSNPTKFYSELLQAGANKQQLQLLQDYNEQNEPKSLTDMITGIMSELSYVVKVDTAKYANREPIYDPNEMSDEFGGRFPGEVAGRPTQYYANLDVPGGQNYTENEISTPDIIPTITGHAQFSTKNGIGWFRSDDQRYTDSYTLPEETEIDYNTLPFEVEGAKFNKGKATTRRILEVQSDLFQKGREKDILTSDEKFKASPRLQELYSIMSFEGLNPEEQKEFDYLEKKELSIPRNQNNNFLQLLNKDGNWIPFFLKSIVQDSAKKGYEKVLFPTGDTASKVEGHQTLEDFIKIKEDRIKILEKEKEDKSKFSLLLTLPNEEPDWLDTFHTKELAQKAIDGADDRSVYKIVSGDYSGENEIKQLKKEIAQVNSEGLAALKPIYNFYENRVKNTLDKIYGKDSVVRIKDEHGNEWYQLEVVSQRDLSKILLQKYTQSEKAPDPEINVKMLYALEKIGIEAKFLDVLTDTKTGEPISDIAKLDLLNKTVEFAQGRMDATSLPEEAAHAYVELLPTGSPLLAKMMAQVVSFKIYAQTVQDYKGDKRYRNADGSINFQKIKKEAIGKILAQTIIGEVPLKEESQSKELMVYQWWKDLTANTEFLFNKFGEQNPFPEMGQTILDAQPQQEKFDPSQIDEYAQKSSAEESINKLEQTQHELILDESTDPSTGQRRHIYQKIDDAGKVIKTIGDSVTSTIDKDFKAKNDDEKEFYLTIADRGTEIHKDLENELKSGLNDDGIVALVKRDNIQKNTNLDVSEKLTAFAQEILSKYRDTSAKLIPECKILDEEYNRGKGLAGTIDLLVVFPDGSYDKYDWKGINDLKGKNRVDQQRRKYYKEQSDKLADILKKRYGLTDRRIDLMVPIHLIGTRQNNELILHNIDITPFDFGKLDTQTKSYLEPVVIHYKESDNDAIEQGRKVLANAIKHILDAGKLGEEYKRVLAAKSADKVQKALFNLIFRKDISTLSDVIQGELNYVHSVVAKQDTSVSLTPYIERMQLVWSKSGIFVQERLEQIKNRIDELKDATDPKEKEEREILEARRANFYTTIGRVENVLAEAQSFAKEFAQEQAEIGFGDKVQAGQPEAEIDFTQKNLTLMSQVPIVVLQTAVQKYHEAITQAELKSEEYAHKIIENVEAVKKAFKQPLLDVYTKYLLETNEDGSLRLLHAYNKNFFDQRKIAAQTYNTEWFKENTIFDRERYTKNYENLKTKVQSLIKESVYTLDEAAEILAEFKQKWDPEEDWSNTQALFQGTQGHEHPNKYLIGKDKFYSDKYKELLKHPSLQDLYNTIIEFNKKLTDEGFIPEGKAYTFFPSVETTLAEAWQQGSPIGLKDRIVDTLTTPNSILHAQENRNALTGEIVRELNVPYINKLEHEERQSKDIGLVYRMLSDRIAHYEEMIKIEPELQQLVVAEGAKGMIVKNKKTKAYDILKPVNTTNLEFTKQMVNFMLYGTPPSGGAALKWWNNALTRFIGIAGRETKLQDIVEGAVIWNSLLRLGLNVSSLTSNLVGGTGNLSFYAKQGQYLTSKQLIEAEGLILSRDKKAKALVHFFKPFTEDNHKRTLDKKAAAKKSIPSITRVGLSGMHLTDEEVQEANALGQLKNHMLDENGNIINIRKAVLSDPEHKKLSPKEQEKLMGEWSKTKSLFATAKLDDKGKPYWEDKDGKKIDLTKKTTTLQSPLTQMQRSIKELSNKILGATSTDDKMGVNMVPMLRAILQFRNWIAGQVRARSARIQYQPYSQTYVKGRWRSFGELFKNLNSSMNLLFSRIGGDKFAPSVKSAAEESYWKDKKTYEQNNPGKEFDMDQDEYFHNYVGTVKSLAREAALIVGFLALLMLIKPSKDDDIDTKKRAAFMSKFLKKWYNEFSFYIDEREFEQLFSNSVPVVGLVGDMSKFVTNLIKELYGQAIDNEDLIKKSYPSKYFLQLFPFFKQGEDLLSLFDEEFRKDWGISYNKAQFY